MLLHEKMRLQRKVSQLTYKQLRASSRKEKITKQIENVQKLYTKREAQIDKTVEMGKSQFRAGILQSLGIGCQGLNPMAFGQMGGTSLFANQKYSELANEVGADKLQAVMSGALTQKDGQYVTADGSVSISPEDYNKIYSGIQGIRMQESQQNYMAQMMETQYNQNASIWHEAAKAQLEAEQDAALMPLHEKETEYDLEDQSCRAQLEYAKAELENIKQELSQSIKDSAISFGLG